MSINKDVSLVSTSEIIDTHMSLISSILIDEMKDVLNEEKPMLAVAMMVVTLMEKTSWHLMQKEMRKFDANPGDAACQAQAVKLHQLVQSISLRKEAEGLLQVAKKIKKEVLLRASNPKAKSKMNAQEFFQKEFASLSISKDMLYLMRTYLLTVTKIVDHIEENGIVVTKTQPSKLSVISKNITDVMKGNICNKFVEHTASQLSRHTICTVQETNNGLKAKDSLTTKMLSDEHIHQPIIKEGHIPKSMSCVYFQMLALLQHLKEQETVIAIKSIVQKDQIPNHYFLKASENGFTVLNEEESKAIDPEIPLVVFEGVIADEKTFIEQIKKIGFEEMILICSAQAPPYDAKSKLEDVKSEEARKIIEGKSAKAKNLGLDVKNNPILLLDHIFCNTLKHENIGKKI